MPKKKIHKRKSHRRKTGKRGGAISDYIPSTDTVASYIPYGTTALKNYRNARNLYNTGKKAFELYQGVINPRQPPPLPPGGPPTDRKSLAQSRRDVAHNRRVDIAKNFYRFRQVSPKKFKYFRIKKITKSIEFVIGYKS